MTVKIVGNVPKIQRIVFDLWSFDLAFSNRNGDLGLPVGIIMEISGLPSSGKSTFSYSFSAMIAKESKQNIALLDLEGFDPDFCSLVLDNLGFDGEVNLVQEETDEDALDELLNLMKKKSPPYGVGIIDCIGAISPLSEAKGDLGEANMGKTAKLVGQTMEKAIKIIRDHPKLPKTLFAINHLHPIMGSRGMETAGGLKLKFLSAERIRLKRKEEFPDGSFIIEGKVTKNRFGYINRNFYLVNLAGFGIHRGLTWIYDGTLQKGGLITREKGNWIKINGENICRLSEAFKQAHAGNTDFFLPFREAVYKSYATPEELVEPNGEEDGDTEDQDTPADED